MKPIAITMAVAVAVAIAVAIAIGIAITIAITIAIVRLDSVNPVVNNHGGLRFRWGLRWMDWLLLFLAELL